MKNELIGGFALAFPCRQLYSYTFCVRALEREEREDSKGN
jgi:hypothetical protein